MGFQSSSLRLAGVPYWRERSKSVSRSGADPIAVGTGGKCSHYPEGDRRNPLALVVINQDWASGMARPRSAPEYARLPSVHRLEAVLVTPCDLPALSVEAIGRLASLHKASGLIAAARYNGRIGGSCDIWIQPSRGPHGANGDDRVVPDVKLRTSRLLVCQIRPVIQVPTRTSRPITCGRQTQLSLLFPPQSMHLEGAWT